MADDPDDLTIQILRQIQLDLGEVKQKLVEHDRRFERLQEQMDHRFDGVERKLGEVIDTSTKVLDTAGVANVRHESVQNQLAEVELELRELRGRLRRLEEKV